MAIQTRRRRPPTSSRTRPKGASSSTSGSATAGACCSRTPRTSRPSAPPSSATVAKLKGEFDKRNVKVIARQRRPVDVAQEAGSATSRRRRTTKMNFPILADADRKVAKLYDMIHPEANDTLTVRSVFVIDPEQEDPR